MPLSWNKRGSKSKTIEAITKVFRNSISLGMWEWRGWKSVILFFYLRKIKRFLKERDTIGKWQGNIRRRPWRQSQKKNNPSHIFYFIYCYIIADHILASDSVFPSPLEIALSSERYCCDLQNMIVGSMCIHLSQDTIVIPINWSCSWFLSVAQIFLKHKICSVHSWKPWAM